jgi:hypothetical protein
MKKILLFTLLLLLSLAACKQEPKTPMEIFYGKWKAQKWLVDGQPMTGFDVSVIQFEFKKDSFYEARFGMSNETGTFNLRNNCFNAMSVYKSPKKCPILRLERDTMVWLMDSVQQPGHLYLVRVKE